MSPPRKPAAPSPIGMRRLLVQWLQAPTSTSNLSIEQHSLWLLRQLDPNAPTHVFAATRVMGPLDVPRLEQSLDVLACRHDILQTAIVDAVGRPLRITAKTRPSLPVIDLVLLSRDERGQEMRRLAQTEAQRPFDLANAPLFRTTLLRYAPDDHVLFVTMHATIADDASLDLFLRELYASYEVLGGLRAPLPESPRKFADFVLWQRRWLQSEDATRELLYWKSQMSDLPVLDLPTDYPRPPVHTHQGVTRDRHMPSDTLARLEELARVEQVGMFEVLLAAFYVLLTRYSGQGDFAVGTPADRLPQWTDCIGPLTNMQVLRLTSCQNPGFIELLRQVYEVRNQTRAHGMTSFDRLVEELQPRRDLSHTPLFQAMFTLGYRKPPLSGASLQWIPVLLETDVMPFDLALAVTVEHDRWNYRLIGNADLFGTETLDRILCHLGVLLDGIASDPKRRISELPLLSEPEWLQIAAWNDTSAVFPRDRCVHQLFEEQVERTPEATAVLFDGQSLSYSELNLRANRLAHHLKAHGVGPEVRVGVYVKRSLETIIGLLGTLKAGGTYVPLDPSYPPARLRFLHDDCGAEVLLTSKLQLGALSSEPLPIMLLDDDEAFAESPADNPPLSITPDNLAYIIYTSGSTGAPKGVMITHRGVVNNLCWRQRTWPLDTSDRVLQHYSFSFDPSVWATFWPLATGAAVTLICDSEHYDAAVLVRRMAENVVTVYGAAPTLHNVMIDEPGIARCIGLRYVFSGGEPLTGELQSRFASRLPARLVNMYGPTEATIDASFWNAPDVNEPGNAPIGYPLPNVEVYILDQHLRPLPIGVPGEIVVAGDGLARGYHQRPGFTAERFVPHPFNTQPGARVYRTGDVGRLRPDGAIEFLGRGDDQVKVRGFRIELGEIEAALRRHEDVSDAAVLVREDVPGNKRLVAYLEVASAAHPSRDSLISHLEQSLPSYMVPREFDILSKLPRTPNEKIDRKALPAPKAHRDDLPPPRAVPSTPLEVEIARAFETVLSVKNVGIDQSFFDLGGNSLLAVLLVSRLSNTYAVDLTVQQVFQEPTVAGIASMIETYRREGAGAMAASGWNWERLAAEAELDAAIDPKGLPVADLFDPRQIFVTGATGYLGIFLIERLLRETTAEIACLIRADNTDEAMQRIEDTFHFYRIWDESFRRRIRPIPGDLARPGLGLSPELFRTLATEVDVIYHCGALVNFVYPYSALKAPNVQGTREVLRIACTTKLKAVHYLSTIDVLLATHAPRPFLENADALEQPAHIPDGYGLSKWVAERLAAIARDRGVPVCIYRPGLIMGHTRTGATQTNNYLFVGLKGYIQLGVLPEDHRFFDAITVDYAARAIVCLSRKPSSIGKLFHLWNPHPVPTMRTYDWIRSFGYGLNTVPHRVARELAIRVDMSNPLYPFVPYFRRAPPDGEASAFDPEIMKLSNAALECSNTLSRLRGSGIECPPIDEPFARNCLSFLVDVGFLPQPDHLGGGLA